MNPTLLASVCIVLIALVAGCASPDAAASVVEVDKSANGGAVTVDKGATLRIKLAENPSTGYAWQVDRIDATLLKRVRDGYVPDCPEGRPGCGGVRTFTLEALAAGETEVLMSERRSWESGEPASTYALRVTIRG